MIPEKLKSTHQKSQQNKAIIDQSDKCGCFYCLEIYTSKEIVEWVDDADGQPSTAICSKCGVDAIIPSTQNIPLTENILKEMHKYWFSMKKE